MFLSVQTLCTFLEKDLAAFWLFVPNISILGTKVVEGRINTVIDSMFTSNQFLDIECKATYDDFLFEKKQLRLTKVGQSQDTSRYGGGSGYNRYYP